MSKEIPLTQGMVAIVDDEDYEYLNQWKWCCHRGYAERGFWNRETRKLSTIYMHRVIMNPPDNLRVDHIDGNKANNQKSNLRIVTNQQNRFNSAPPKNAKSKYKGVCWNKEWRKWGCHIKINRKQIFLGYFLIEEEAARAYDQKAKDFFGEYAWLNFPDE